LVKLHSFSLSLCSFSFSGSINLYGLRFLVLALVCFFLFDGVLCLVSEKKMRKNGEGKESKGLFLRMLISHGNMFFFSKRIVLNHDYHSSQVSFYPL
jgi:hypothetical protein